MDLPLLRVALLSCAAAACASPPPPQPEPAPPAIAAPAPADAGAPSPQRTGRLPPEIIQRVVRGNFDAFRHCYEDGLRRDPTLQGRIGIRFVIGRDGRVTAVGNGGSDMPDAAVVACVVGAFYALVFPPPDGGIVTVVYPIMFSPGDAADAGTAQPDAGPALADAGLAPPH